MTDLSGIPQSGSGGSPHVAFSLTGLMQALQTIAQAIYKVQQTLNSSFIQLAANNTFTGSNSFTQPIIGPIYLVSALPSAATKGQRAFASDATATTFDSIVAGSGSNFVPVFSDGTSWRIG